MSCDRIRSAMKTFETCTETPAGFRVMTHCLYPSFEPVDVYVVGFGDGFRVHDRGGARREAWLHGVDDAQTSRILNAEASKHQVRVENGSLLAITQTPEWLFAAITAVSNASANAAKVAIESVHANGEESLVEHIENTLNINFPDRMIRKNYKFRGKSGKDHHFDFALRDGGERTILISAVATHHFSISSKYVAFADTRIYGYENLGRFAVIDRELEEADASLLGQVADIVPLSTLSLGAIQLMARQSWPTIPHMSSQRG